VIARISQRDMDHDCCIRNAALTMEASLQLTRDQFNHYMQKLIKNELSVNLMEWQPGTNGLQAAIT